MARDESPSKIQRAVIAGASEALKIKISDSKKNDDEIIQSITKRMEAILENID